MKEYRATAQSNQAEEVKDAGQSREKILTYRDRLFPVHKGADGITCTIPLHILQERYGGETAQSRPRANPQDASKCQDQGIRDGQICGRMPVSGTDFGGSSSWGFGGFSDRAAFPQALYGRL